MASSNTGKLAVLIDADNAQASNINELFVEVSRYGTASVKRAYGDWTTPNLKGWKDVLHKLAIQPMQQFSYTTGKNATDSSLIIDAMDLLHSGGLDGFCLVSSDSDFTRLATRIREAGLLVYGFGEDSTAICGCLRQVHLHRNPQATSISGSRGPVAPTLGANASSCNRGIGPRGWMVGAVCRWFNDVEEQLVF